MTMCEFQAWALKDNVASVLLSFGSLMLGAASCHVIRTLQQPFGETHGQEQDIPCRDPTSTCQPREGATLETPTPGKPSDECT